VSSYCNGFVNGIAEQLRASRAEIKETSNSTAMIKIDARYDQAKAALYQMHSNLIYKKTHSQSRTNNEAFGMGQQRGVNMHLGANLGSGSGKLLGK
jgi:hypothetical protein